VSFIRYQPSAAPVATPSNRHSTPRMRGFSSAARKCVRRRGPDALRSSISSGSSHRGARRVFGIANLKTHKSKSHAYFRVWPASEALLDPSCGRRRCHPSQPQPESLTRD
jgi:hypothetical protein